MMSANNRERERAHEGKGERVLEKRESGLGGVIKAQASRTEPRRPNSYAWLPGRCVTGISQQAKFFRIPTKRECKQVSSPGILVRAPSKHALRTKHRLHVEKNRRGQATVAPTEYMLST